MPRNKKYSTPFPASMMIPQFMHMDEQNILNAVSIEKDVDGFHLQNIGCLAMGGKRAVVIGRSNIVGMPGALLLQREDATVSIVHSRTKNPEELTRQADIVIAAVGQTNMVRGSWIEPGAVVIDVGINPVEDKKKLSGFRLVGDVCYKEAKEITSAITP
ncbi:hypothetical protein M0R45_034482 [Rubus argutus]|uniref:Tetrahydrofolate dehydrogenase/cyclohydrolase NAD(P)-binding domain-containing protein n=1 Tax=Rubus argutus TaxID=59490 RepID=A0AAW1VQ97_RUBAR